MSNGKEAGQTLSPSPLGQDKVTDVLMFLCVLHRLRSCLADGSATKLGGYLILQEQPPSPHLPPRPLSLFQALIPAPCTASFVSGATSLEPKLN